jgi:hypothetical protein
MDLIFEWARDDNVGNGPRLYAKPNMEGTTIEIMTWALPL